MVGIIILQVNATDHNTGLTGLVRYRVNTVLMQLVHLMLMLPLEKYSLIQQ